MSQRGRHGSENGMEVMQVSKHILMTISFSLEDAQGVQMLHEDTLVIEVVIHNFWVQKVLGINGSKVNLLSNRVFQQMRIPKV